jgi:hypothetical protein
MCRKREGKTILTAKIEKQVVAIRTIKGSQRSHLVCVADAKVGDQLRTVSVFIRYKIFVKNILACTFQTKLGIHLLYGIGPRVIVYCCAQKLNRCQLMNAKY